MSSSVAMPAAPLAEARRPVKLPGHPGLFRKGSTVITLEGARQAAFEVLSHAHGRQAGQGRAHCGR